MIEVANILNPELIHDLETKIAYQVFEKYQERKEMLKRSRS